MCICRRVLRWKRIKINQQVERIFKLILPLVVNCFEMLIALAASIVDWISFDSSAICNYSERIRQSTRIHFVNRHDHWCRTVQSNSVCRTSTTTHRDERNMWYRWHLSIGQCLVYWQRREGVFHWFPDDSSFRWKYFVPYRVAKLTNNRSQKSHRMPLQ